MMKRIEAKIPMKSPTQRSTMQKMSLPYSFIFFSLLVLSDLEKECSFLERENALWTKAMRMRM